MLSKNLFRFTSLPTYLPKTITCQQSMFFSNRENEALARILRNKEDSSLGITDEERRIRGFKNVYTGKGPDAIIQRRRLQEEYLTVQKKRKESLPQLFESPGELNVDLTLYMEHFDPESQLVDAMLNYHEVSYIRNDNLLYLDNFKSVHAKNKPNLKFPVLKVHIGLEPEVLLIGTKEIESYLIKTNFISNPMHYQNSAYSQQTIDFVKSSVRPNLDMLFWSPILTYENLFRGSGSTYRGNFRNYMLIRAIRLLFQNVAKNIFKNYGSMWRNRKEYKNSRQLVLNNFDEWTKRLGTKPFHGGEEPDEADFEMYATVKSKYNSRSFRHFLEYKCPDKFYRWFVRMQLKCIYDPERVNIIE